jgi:hypothetical protein
MRETHLARFHFQPAADERRHRGGMMRVAERAHPGNRAVGKLARETLHHRDFERLARI